MIPMRSNAPLPLIALSLALLALHALPGVAEAENPTRFRHLRQIPLTPAEAKEARPAAVAAPTIKKPPAMDGVLDDECWKQAGTAAPFYKCDDSIPMDILADVPTEVLVCRDPENLYLGWKLTGKVAKQMAAKFKPGGKHNGRYGRGLAILQPMAADDWYGFYFNPDGGCSPLSQKEAENYKAEFTLAVKPVEDGAAVELAIPFKNPGLHVPKEGEWWRFQLGRVDNNEWTAWSNSRGTHEIPARYGYIFFGSLESFEKKIPPVPAGVEFVGESRRYRADESTTQFLCSLQGISHQGRALRFDLMQLDAGKRIAVDTLMVAELKEPKAAFLYDLRGLPPATYEMVATLTEAGVKPVDSGRWAFAVTAEREQVVPFPEEGVAINVHEQLHAPNAHWPIDTGVPLPFGSVYDVGELGLFENGQRIPCNVVARATWLPSLSPDAKDETTDNGGFRWVGLSFVAKYDQGSPRRYVLRKVAKDALAARSLLVVKEASAYILIQTGPAQITVNKMNFDGVSGAWLDFNRNGQFEPAEQLILPGGGPAIVDEKDKRYEARHRTGRGNTNVTVAIEEQGPAKVVVSAKGWYHTDQGDPLCIYHTRIIAYAGLPFFRVKHRTILTYDTKTNKLADIAFALPTPPMVWGCFGADRGAEWAAAKQNTALWSNSLLQDRPNHFRIVREWLGAKEGQRAVVTEAGKEGVRADGRVTVYTDREYKGVMVTLKDVWQKYPKELEISSQGISLHFWPLHGGDTFADQEELSRGNIHKLLWAHEGKFLDMQIPARYRERLHEICKTDGFGLGESVEVGYGSNGSGAAISNEFVVHLNDPKSEIEPPPPALVQQDPHGFADPAYACATNALEKVHPKDEARFGPLERLIEKGYLAMTRFFSNTGEWGMWNYADLHTYPYPGVGYPNLHRVWLASHYRNVQTAWLMYFRSGSPAWLAWARAYGDHFMNVDMCHYDDPENPLVGTDPEGKLRLGYVIRIAGAMMHCKGFSHWSSDLNVATHFIDPDAILWMYYLTGDYAARDAYDLWARAIGRVPLPYAADRETNNTLAAILALYKHSWDPQLLLHVHRIGDVLVGTPLASHNSGCMWNVFWMDRYFGLTRDDRIIERAKELLVHGRDSTRNSLAYSTFSALCYEQTRDPTYVSAAIDFAYKVSHAIYLNPEDPYDGWPQMRYLATENFAYTASPRWMRAMAQAGIPFKLEREPCDLPSGGPSFNDPSGANSNFEMLFLETEDQDIALTIEFRARQPSTFRLFDPEGKKAVEASAADGNHFGDKAVKLALPKDQKTGLHRMTGYAYESVARLPLTQLPGEAAVLRPAAAYTISGLFYYLSPPAGYQGEVLLEIGGPSGPAAGGQGPTLVQLTGPQGEALLDSSVAGFLQRHTVRALLNTAKNPPPWRLFVAADVGFRFSGPGKLYVGADPARVTAMAKADPPAK